MIDLADRIELHELPGRYGDAIDLYRKGSGNEPGRDDKKKANKFSLR